MKPNKGFFNQIQPKYILPFDNSKVSQQVIDALSDPIIFNQLMNLCNKFQSQQCQIDPNQQVK